MLGEITDVMYGDFEFGAKVMSILIALYDVHALHNSSQLYYICLTAMVEFTESYYASLPM